MCASIQGRVVGDMSEVLMESNNSLVINSHLWCRNVATIVFWNYLDEFLGVVFGEKIKKYESTLAPWSDFLSII